MNTNTDSDAFAVDLATNSIYLPETLDMSYMVRVPEIRAYMDAAAESYAAPNYCTRYAFSEPEKLEKAEKILSGLFALKLLTMEEFKSRFWG